MPSYKKEITAVLRNISSGDADAWNDLWPQIHGELRKIASKYLAKELNAATLQPTVLVHEAFLRMTQSEKLNIQDRKHFFAIAARIMRYVLIDHAKAKRAAKRGSGQRNIELQDHHVAEGPTWDVLEVSQALEKLEQFDERLAQVVELKFFGGLELTEIGEVLGVSVATVKRDWTTAKLWLFRELSQET